jgi:hypothetical protein
VAREKSREGHILWVNLNTAMSVYQVKRTVATLLNASENAASAFCQGQKEIH